MSEKSIETSLVSLVNRLPDLIRRRHESLEEFNAGALHSDYLVMVEDRLQSLDYLPGILEKVQTRLAATTITAVTLLVGVPNVDVMDVLDSVQTRRSVLDAGVRTGSRFIGMVGGESTRKSSRFALPSYDNLAIVAGESTRAPRHHGANNVHSAAYQNGLAAGKAAGSELHLHQDHNDNSKMTVNHYEGGGKKAASISSTLPSNAIKQLYESEGLSTGKQFSVVVERDGNKAELMLSLRLNTQIVPQEMMRTFLAFADSTNDFWDRVVRIKAGALRGWRDGFNDAVNIRGTA